MANNNIDKMKSDSFTIMHMDFVHQTDNVQLYDTAQLLSLCMGDKTFLKSMLDMFVNVCEEAIQQMNDALKINSPERVKKISHKIKPSLYSLNVTSIYTDVLVLESIEHNDTLTMDEKQRATRLMYTMKQVVDEIKNTL